MIIEFFKKYCFLCAALGLASLIIAAGVWLKSNARDTALHYRQSAFILSDHLRASTDMLELISSLVENPIKVESGGFRGTIETHFNALEKETVDLSILLVSSPFKASFLFGSKITASTNSKFSQARDKVVEVWPVYSEYLLGIVENDEYFQTRQEESLALALKYAIDYHSSLDKLNDFVLQHTQNARKSIQSIQVLFNWAVGLATLISAAIIGYLSYRLVFQDREASDQQLSDELEEEASYDEESTGDEKDELAEEDVDIPILGVELKSDGSRVASMVSRMIAMDREIVADFVEEALPSLENIVGFFNEVSSTQETLRENLNFILRTAHRVKGDAAMLKFENMVTQLHEIEDRLAPLQNKRPLAVQDFDGVKLMFSPVIEELKNIDYIISQIDQENLRPQDVNSNNQFFQYLQKYANTISRDVNKKVRVVDGGFDQASIPETFQKDVFSMITQLIRNAIVHGIEDELQRKRSNKELIGTVQVGVDKQHGCFSVTIKDDGGGLDLAKIKQVAIRSGRFDRTQIEKCTRAELATLIFQPGISTASKVDQHAGRGVGLDIVSTAVKELGGRFSTRTRKGAYTEFTMTFPELKGGQAVTASA